MRTRLRRLPTRRLAIATAIGVPVAIWLATLEGGLILGAGSRGEGCRSFWGETVDRVAWSPAGTFLVVGTVNTEALDSGDGVVRVFSWPGMEVVSLSRQIYATPEITIDDAGVLAWFTEGFRDSRAILPVPPTAWRLDPGGVPRTSDDVPSGPSRPISASSDVSTLGILAEASAPGPQRPNQLCVDDPTGSN
jgi:hypothetical protein